jgi:hypothetical protein
MARRTKRVKGAVCDGCGQVHGSCRCNEEAFMFLVRSMGWPEPTREFPFAHPRKYRADFAWIDQRVLVEIEGAAGRGRHTHAKGYEEDCRKYDLAGLLGWQVLRFTPAMIESGEAAIMVDIALAPDDEPIEELYSYWAAVRARGKP